MSEQPPPDPDAVVRQRRRARWEAQARDGIARLEADPRDADGRGLLGEVVGRWDDELPGWLADARDRLLVPVLPELPIRTERLVLRRLRADDAADLHGYYGRDDVATHLLTPPWSRDEAEAEVRRRLGLGVPDPGPPEALGLVMELDGRVVGDVVLIFKPPEYSQAEIGWAVHPDAGGRGLVTEAARALLDLAFGHYGFHRVTAQLDARNTASARMCERLGMRLESTLRRDFWSKGEWTDSLHYALLAEEHSAG